MEKETQNLPQDIRYKVIVLKRSKEYAIKNKEKIKECQRKRYKNLNQEEKKRLFEKRKEWFNRQSEEKQEDMSRKAREYAKKYYHNHMGLVKLICYFFKKISYSMFL